MRRHARIHFFTIIEVYMSNATEQTISEPRPSASVVLLRDKHQQIEILMVQKNQTINFGGSWVFPGGIVEKVDSASDSGQLSSIESAKQTVYRETLEETSIALNKADLVALSKWVTPKQMPKRYSTWFFVCDANAITQSVVIDNQEIVDSKWLTPEDALSMHCRKKMKLNGPSFVILNALTAFKSAKKAIAQYQRQTPPTFLPRTFANEDGYVSLFQEDCGYALPQEEVLAANGKKHRTLMFKNKAWEYICEF